MAKLPFSLFLALRYLKPKRTFLSIITLISVAGVTLGIMVLILVIAVMTGFDEELREKVLGFDAHLFVTNNQVIDDWRELRDKITALPEVVAVAPFVQGPVIVEFNHRRLAPKIRGIDPEEEEKVTRIEKYVQSPSGKVDLDGDKAILGSEMAYQLGVRVGDTVTVHSPGNIAKLFEGLDAAEKDPKALRDLRELVLPADLEVTGIFNSGRFAYDSEFLLVPLYVGQELYDLAGGVHGLSVRTTDPYIAVKVQREIEAILPPGYRADTWIDLNKQLFDAIRLERNVMFFLLLFIVIVAAFGIMNTLITVTVQKTREIGIMKALGATTWQIVWVFLAQGMVVGFFGNIIGLIAGMTMVTFRNEFKNWLASTLGIEIFPAQVYQFSEIPAKVVPHDVAIICISAFVICSLAALIPAYFAARLEPVKALRFD